MTTIRNILIALLALLGIGVLATPAGAFPVGAKPILSKDCGLLSIDPPPQHYSITVTFAGKINGVAYTRAVTYGAPTPHIATVDISDLTTATGPLHITSTATAPFLGTSGTLDVTVTCHEAPTTPTTEATTSTTVAPPSTTASTVTPPTPPSQLPRTGSTSVPLGLFGIGLAAVGAVLARTHRRPRKA